LATLVLLHGAWHGGWCWAGVAARLRAAGHLVTTPTQTGLGERRREMSRDITLETFGTDLLEHLFFEDLSDVVLVGHSFGGNAVSIAAERAPERLRRLVYLDALILEGGESGLSRVPGEVAAARRAAAEAHDGGVSIPPPPAEGFGIEDPALAAALAARLTPHPLGAYDSPLPIAGAPGGGLPAVYVRCTAPVYAPLVASAERARGYGWETIDLAAGHDAMWTAPEATAALLAAEAAK